MTIDILSEITLVPQPMVPLEISELDDRIYQLMQRIEMLESEVKVASLQSKHFVYDLTELAEQIIPNTVKISVTYGRNSIFSDDLEVFPFSGHGSGCVISQDGYILTNFHVISGASSVEVFNNHTQTFYDAEVCQSDPDLDLALLKIDAEDLPYFTIGDSDRIKVGDFIVLTGNPLGFKNLLTMGVVGSVACGLFEAYDYSWETGDVGRFSDYIISDAICNPGNSGGPLVNLSGNLVGIASRGGEGLGLAISSKTALDFLSSIDESGSLQRNVFPAELALLSSQDKKYFGLSEDLNHAAIVVDIANDSNLFKAGLRKGDVLLHYDSKPFYSLDEFRYDIARTTSEKSSMIVEILRNKEISFLEIPLNSEAVYSLTRFDRLGIGVQTLKDFQTHDLNYDSSLKGLLISEVDILSTANLAGIYPGDVIVSVIDSSMQEIKIENLEDFYEAYLSLEDKKTIYVKLVSSFAMKPRVVTLDF